MTHPGRILAPGIFLVLVALSAVACGAAEEAPTDEIADRPVDSGSRGPGGPQGAEEPQGPQGAEEPRAGADTALRPTASPEPTLGVDADATAPEEEVAGAAGYDGAGDAGSRVRLASRSQVEQRIIVRTVDITLEVGGISSAMDNIGSVASELGGWTVSSKHTQKHAGFIAVRVPADRLDEAVDRLKTLAVDVQSESSTSRDFTDEYVDLQSRKQNLQATADALTTLLDRAQNVEEALKVQQELTTVQEEIETIQGRLNYLEQTSAYSLINATLELPPVQMTTSAGDDRKVRVGEVVSFRARFTPPEGVEEFSYTWDFGDTTPPVGGTRTAPVVDGDEDERVTATITHTYAGAEHSPYIVSFSIEGTGEGGVAKGRDTVLVEVLEVPEITVFAGEDITVTEGEPVTLGGSLTRPKGLTDFQYRWDFGDGSEEVTGDVPPGETNITATHTYPDHRPQPFVAALEITAQSETGPVEAGDSVNVSVQETTPLVMGWNMDRTLRTAVFSLSVVGQALGTAVIWLGIFTPVWVPLALLLYWARRSGRLSGRRRPGGDGQQTGSGASHSETENGER